MALYEHLAWARSPFAQKSNPSPGQGREQSTSGSSLRTRLGESLSPEQDSVSPKPRALRLGELLEQNLGESQLFSPRRDELAWARITVLVYCYAHAAGIQLKSNISEHKQDSSYHPKHQSSIISWYRPKACRNSS